MTALPDRHYGGPESQETAVKKAQCILSEELRLEQMGQVRLGSHMQRLRNPSQCHCRFLPQNSPDAKLLRIAFRTIQQV